MQVDPSLVPSLFHTASDKNLGIGYEAKLTLPTHPAYSLTHTHTLHTHPANTYTATLSKY